MAKYQYKVVTVKTGTFSSQEKKDQQVQDRLNRLALEGWELVTVEHAYGSYPQLYMRK